MARLIDELSERFREFTILAPVFRVLRCPTCEGSGKLEKWSGRFCGWEQVACPDCERDRAELFEEKGDEHAMEAKNE